MNCIQFGKITNIILFGGEQRLIDAIKIIQHYKLNLAVFAGIRHLEQLIGDKTLKEHYWFCLKIQNRKILDINKKGTLCRTEQNRKKFS